ncbi:MAG: amidohydrolase [Bacteroidia bacterium]|nr:amidohydrolase [Bacteroidia bacterium]
MKIQVSLLFILFALLGSLTAQGQKDKIISYVEAQKDIAIETADKIWALAELGYQENESTMLLQGVLKDAGFNVQSSVAGIPTAFVAEYGSGKPVIGILAEFDALPGISQDAVPTKQKRENQENGHACGHHLFGSASSNAAVAVKKWLENSGQSGTIRVYGTPAEEGGAGKVYLVREGMFDDVDVVLHWHPGDGNTASAGSSLANKSAKFRFHGRATHAAGAPHRGRSGLDGVEAMNYMVNLMREHVTQESRIHYVITRGGEAPNVVPAFAEVYYYIRHPEMAEVKAMFERVVKAAEGAAMGTGTTMDYEVIHGIYNLLPNAAISRVMYDNLKKVGGVAYTEEEKSFAHTIISTFQNTDAKPEDAIKIDPFTVTTRGRGGSTDVGDVSWMVPTAGLRAATWVPGTSAHSWQAVAAGGMSIGHKGMMVAAKTLALTAYDLFNNPEVIKKGWSELIERRGEGFEYEALLGDRPPPLDYRN